MEIVIRSSVMFWAIWGITRLLGKRELAQMSPFELIVLIVTGDLIQQGVTQEDFSVTGAVSAVAVFALWAVLLSMLGNRSTRLRRVLDGQPVIVVREGRLLEDMMRHERITDDDVKEAARARGIATIDEIDVGILEPDGSFSFLRSDSRPTDPPARHQV